MDYTVTIINTSGVHKAQLDNTGATDVSDDINDIISKFVDDNGLDLFLNPGVYLLHKPINIHRSNISIQGYCYGFRYSPKRLGVKGKTVFLPAPSCTDAIRLGPASDRDTLHGFTLRNITIGGQNGKLDMRPNIIRPQNGVRVMENTVRGISSPIRTSTSSSSTATTRGNSWIIASSSVSRQRRCEVGYRHPMLDLTEMCLWITGLSGPENCYKVLFCRTCGTGRYRTRTCDLTGVIRAL